MSFDITYDRFWLRRKTTAQWQATNEVLYQGEMGVELRGIGVPDGLKVGDGVTPWLGLAYVGKSVALPVFVQAGVVTLDANKADLFQVELAANATLAIINPPPAGRLLLRVTPIGGALLTLPANVTVIGGTYTTGTVAELLEFVTFDGVTFNLRAAQTTTIGAKVLPLVTGEIVSGQPQFVYNPDDGTLIYEEIA